MDVKCPKCKSKELNVSKPLIRKMPLFKMIVLTIFFWSIWNIAASITGRYCYTCTKCGKRFK